MQTPKIQIQEFPVVNLGFYKGLKTGFCRCEMAYIFEGTCPKWLTYQRPAKTKDAVI